MPLKLMVKFSWVVIFLTVAIYQMQQYALLRIRHEINYITYGIYVTTGHEPMLILTA